MQQVLIHRILLKKTDLANLKSDVDKLDIGKLKNVPINLSNLESKVDQLDVDKLVSVPVDLSKLIDVVKNNVVKKLVYNAKIRETINLNKNVTSNKIKNVLELN